MTLQVLFHLGVTLLSGLRVSWPQAVFCKATCRIVLNFSRGIQPNSEAYVSRRFADYFRQPINQATDLFHLGVTLLSGPRESWPQDVFSKATCRILLNFSRGFQPNSEAYVSRRFADYFRQPINQSTDLFHLGVTLLSGLREFWPQDVFGKATCRILLNFSR